jgi:7-carboxy-7-deazaguanine synthase
MKIKISEIFPSIQGEGKFSGIPMLFIRLYGCTRRCWFCDTKYAVTGGKYQEMDTDELVKRIKKSKLVYICWTGGESLLQRDVIRKVINRTREYYHHAETNGDLLESSDFYLFHYLAISPKEKKVAEKVRKLCLEFNPDIWDIKVVTDLNRIGVDMIPYATMLMPLSTYDKKKDREICKKVWEYCVKNNLKFSPRLQTFIYGKKRGI